MKNILVLIFAIFSIMQTYASDEMIVCPMDAKMCSDGSAVGRSGPNCEFVCPGDQVKIEPKICPMDVKMCSDGSSVGRNGPNCEFVCPGDEVKKEPKMCTMQYDPVCGEVQIQCIKAPCNPIIQTFGNKCELGNTPLASYLYDGECVSDKLKTKINTFWEKNISEIPENKKEEKLNKLFSKIEKLLQIQDISPIKQSILGHLKNLVLKSLGY